MINTWLNVQVNISFLNQHFSNYRTLSINYWMPINYRALNYVVREALKNKSSQSLFLYLNISSQLRRIVVSLGCGVDDAWDGGHVTHVTMSRHATLSPEPRHGDCSAQKNIFGKNYHPKNE